MPVVACPSCGREMELKPHPERPWRVVGFCECHPQGAVVEMDAPPPESPRGRGDKRGSMATALQERSNE